MPTLNVPATYATPALANAAASSGDITQKLHQLILLQVLQLEAMVLHLMMLF
jgi:hypothetical protein